MRDTGHWMDGNDLIVRQTEDVEPHLEHAKALRSIGATGSSELKHAAHFPASAIMAYCQKHGIDMHEWAINPVHIRRMLNDPELSGYRVWTGRVKSGEGR